MINPADIPELKTADRLQRLRVGLADQDVDAAVFSDTENVRWLTGFTGSQGVLVIGLTEANSDALLITDGRYTQQASAELQASGCSEQVEVVIDRSASKVTAEKFGTLRRLGLEVSVSWAFQRAWDEKFEAEIIPLVETVEHLRTVKDDAELARIEVAAAIADHALSEIKPRLRPGENELSIQFALDVAMRNSGAAGPAFETIVASGPNSALPHARPSNRRLQAGDLVVIDIGAEYAGYRSDMTRTFLVSSEDANLIPPSSSVDLDADSYADVNAIEPADLIELVTRSQAAGIAAVRPGVEAAEVDRACRSVIEDADLGEYFVHATGHGVGLDIHEIPGIATTSKAVLQPGNVITIEPGVYIPGVGGVRVEDLLVVTQDGYRIITRYPKYTGKQNQVN
ncbi:MAG: Xaa-Pro peptidase family protein [Acidimicrobiaceae bacterium]|nr:Xaa-Pro peptidase family protein [Acidimicrobiaceae bacterium]